MRAAPALLGALLLLLGACAPRSEMTLAYTSAAQPLAASGPPVAVEVVDQRRRPANEVGEIRGLMASTVARATTARPVAEVVRQGFVAGLAARGLAVAQPGAARTLHLTLAQFDAVQLVQRGGNARLDAVLRDAGGRELWRASPRLATRDGTISGGAGTGKVQDLQPTLNRLLRETVDRILDDPGFRAALPNR